MPSLFGSVLGREGELRTFVAHLCEPIQAAPPPPTSRLKCLQLNLRAERRSSDEKRASLTLPGSLQDPRTQGRGALGFACKKGRDVATPNRQRCEAVTQLVSDDTNGLCKKGLGS